MSLPQTNEHRPDHALLADFRRAHGAHADPYQSMLAMATVLRELAPGQSIEHLLGAPTSTPERSDLLLDYEAFATRSGPPPEWLVDELIPRGAVTMLVGPPKAGKSSLLRCLVRSVATGTPFLGRRTQQGFTVLLPIEERAADVAGALRKLGVPPDRVVIPCSETRHLDLDPETGATAETVEIAVKRDLASIEADVRRLRPALVVLDPMILGLSVEDGNDYVEGYRAIDQWRRMASLYGSAVVLCHHTGKIVHETISQRGLGSTAYGGAVWGTLALRSDANGVRTLDTVGRSGNHFSRAIIELDPETLLVRVAGSVAERQRQTIAELMLDVAHDLPTEGFTRDDLLRQVDGRAVEKTGALRELVARGALVKIGGSGRRGDPFRYAVPATPGAPEVPVLPGLPDIPDDPRTCPDCGAMLTNDEECPSCVYV